MDIGKLNKRATIEKRVVTQDPTYGTDVITWQTLDTRWCNIQDVLPSRDEQIRQGIAATTVKARIRFRYCSDIDTSMRIRVMRPNAQIWNIIGGPAEVGNRDGVEFMIERNSVTP